MENIPPSYESAMARNPWQILAPYIPSADLCALNRVNRALHEVFAPCLWGNPASHFGTENDRVYVALTRFKRALKRVRRSVRELTHTLHLPAAQSEIYDGPRPEWLRDVLEQLPNLQSLVVSRLPFFDHLALLALKHRGDGRYASEEEIDPAFSLRLLVAARCQNTTSHGLAEALKHFPHLAFLDLSNTLAARDKNVFARLRNLPLLDILKLRCVHLKDDDMEVLAEAIGTRVRSLDVQGNHLTDHSVRKLLSTCFRTAGAPGASIDGPHLVSTNLAVEDWPSGFVRPDPAVLDEFKDESYDERFVRRLTSGITSRLPYEDMPSSGITHLYIADNNLTVEGLVSLVRSQMLRVLDAGSLKYGTILNRPRSASSTSTPNPFDDHRTVRIPGVEKLTPFLGRYGGELTSLRIHHALVTEISSAKIDKHATKCELSAESTAAPELEGDLSNQPVELDAAPPLYELEPNEPVPRFELPGDSTRIIISPPIGAKPTLSKEESQPEANRGGIFAPEVVEQDESQGEKPLVLTATGCLGPIAQGVNGVTSPVISEGTDIVNGASSMGQEHHEMQIALIEKQRQELRSTRLAKPRGLTPGIMPNLRTLTLTDVPTHARHDRVHQSLIQFIKDCAFEAELADLQARLEPSPIRKPGERQSRHHHLLTREIFALRQIILEMAPAASSISNHTVQASNLFRDTKSSTEDADSEALWSAAENDFTFFDDDEECGLPSVETNSWIPYSALSEKIMMTGDGPQMGKSSSVRRPPPNDSMIDLVQEIATFRKERKAAFESAVTEGAKHAEGYWPGEVKVVRGHHAGGKTDYYGNHFEKTGVYR